MFTFAFQFGHSQSGANYAVNLVDLPVVAPLLESIFAHLHQLAITVPDQIPAIFYAQKPGFKGGLRVLLPPGTHPKNAHDVAPPGPILPEDQTDAEPAQLLQDDLVPPAPLQEKLPKGKILCKICKLPQSKPNLARHMRVFHSDDPHPFKCIPPCKYTAPRRDQLLQHQAPSEGCSRFGSSFVIPYITRISLIIASWVCSQIVVRNKGSNCADCGEHVPGSMARHKTANLCKAKFSCLICNSKFSYQNQLKRHMSDSH